MPVYRTSDIYLAAFLLSYNHDLKTLSNEGSKVVFQFEMSPTIEVSVSSFFTGSGQVCAKTFVYHVRRLKRELANVLRGG